MIIYYRETDISKIGAIIEYVAMRKAHLAGSNPRRHFYRVPTRMDLSVVYGMIYLQRR
jgi:hypothetical protein